MTSREKKYLEMLRIHNTKNITWREFYTKLYGQCHWMDTTQYGGSWLDKIMGDSSET
jgi:hypothetical protein